MTVKWYGKKIERQVEEATWQVVQRRTEATLARAKESILSGPKSGRIYGEHQASAPGEAPANWTGELVASGATRYNRAQLYGEVVFTAPYALALEYGTEKMEPRPYLRPAAFAEDQKMPLAEEIIQQVRRGLKGEMG